MPTIPLAEKLLVVQAQLAAVNESISILLGKTNHSVSFGDQSYTLVDVDKLLRIRNSLRSEESALEATLIGGPRRTIKISFPLA